MYGYLALELGQKGSLRTIRNLQRYKSISECLRVGSGIFKMGIFLIQQVIYSRNFENFQVRGAQDASYRGRPRRWNYDLCAIKSREETLVRGHAVARRCEEHLRRHS